MDESDSGKPFKVSQLGFVCEWENKEPATEPAALMPGDVNLDKAVDILDVIALNKYLLGSSKLKADGLKNADVNHSGTPDADDSLLSLKYALEIIKEF